MEIKSNSLESESIADFLGITKEIAMNLAAKNSVAFLDYITEIASDENAGKPENKLFKRCIANCETFEQALFLTFHFQSIISEVLNRTLVDSITITTKEKINLN